VTIRSTSRVCNFGADERFSQTTGAAVSFNAPFVGTSAGAQAGTIATADANAITGATAAPPPPRGSARRWQRLLPFEFRQPGTAGLVIGSAGAATTATAPSTTVTNNVLSFMARDVMAARM